MPTVMTARPPTALRVSGAERHLRVLRASIAPGEVAGALAGAGDLAVMACATREGIARIDVVVAEGARLPEGVREERALEPMARLIARCLEAHVAEVEELPLDVEGTAFQVEVWRALRDIRVGETTSYGALAQRLECGVGGARAVGQAVGANPVPIVVPCHRVLAGGGKPGGFALGLAMKRRLLVAEGALLA
jgi:O-6-methylguanine DNA methyltransferase